MPQKHDVIVPETNMDKVLISNSPIEVSCKFEVIIFKMVLVIKHYVWMI